MKPQALRDFHKELRARGLTAPAPFAVVRELVVHLSLLAAGLLIYGLANEWPVRLLGLPLVMLGSISAATNSHTSAHGATSRLRIVNEALSFFGFSFVTMYSYVGWCTKHNIEHHSFTNIEGQDPDHEFMPFFALTDAQLARVPAAERRRYKRQWLLFPLGVLVMAPRMRLVALGYLARALRIERGRKHRKAVLDVMILSLSVAVWWVLPLIYASPVTVLVLHAARTLALSYGMFCIFAPAHLPAAAPTIRHVDAAMDPMLHQVSVTLDFHCSRVSAFFLSGLNYQIEHHVAPRVPHVRYREVAPLLEAFCAARGFPYRVLPWRSAIKECFGIAKTPKRSIESLEESLWRPA